MMMMPASLAAVTTLSTSIAIKNLCFQRAVCLGEGRWLLVLGPWSLALGTLSHPGLELSGSG